MKKRVLFAFLIVFIILNLSLMIAQGNQTGVNSAYDCLESKVEDKCSSLTFEQQIFSLLAIGECADEVLDDSGYMSNLKLTAQAVLALDRTNKNTEDAEEWLLDSEQNEVPAEMDWLLQIDSTEVTSCTITPEESTPTSVTINADKTLTITGTSTCFSLYGDDYWLRISPDCYSQEFTISCNQAFSTNLIYKKSYEDTFFVSGATHSTSAGGTTTEEVNSFCFAQGGSCNYEASLWAALVLNFKGHDVSFYLPYLITMRDEVENQQYLPESFLYSLTGDYKGELLSTSAILPVSDNKYYDTALAFLPLQKETIEEKTNAMDWLLNEAQGNDGCWNSGNIRDTAFILYSFWPRTLSISGDEGLDCENTGYYCMSPMSCSDAEGDVLEEYSGCFGTEICCTSPRPLENCADQGGEVCGSGETCTISTTEALDTLECCLGSCRTPSEETECELYADGTCRTSCYSDEEESNYLCESGQICCVEKTSAGKKSYWWVWLLLILIFFVVLGIIFKDKLRQFWFKIKSKLGKGKGKQSTQPKGPRFPPLRPGMPPQKPMPRKILPPSQKGPIRKPVRKSSHPRGKGDIDEVLKKLKEMGK